MRLNLKLFRIRRKLKQSDIAKKLGMTPAAYSMIEQGKRDGTMTFWNKLQNAFNIPENEMWALMKNEEE